MTVSKLHFVRKNCRIHNNYETYLAFVLDFRNAKNKSQGDKLEGNFSQS